MPKPTPRKLSRESHLKIIIILLLITIGALLLSHYLGTQAISRRILPQPMAATVAHPAPPSPSTSAPTSATPSTQGESSPSAPPSSPPKKTSPQPVSHALPQIQFELPLYTEETFIRINTQGRYTLCYDTSYRQAAWVAYLLTKAEVQRKGTKRANQFRPDPQVLHQGWPSAQDRDYEGSGYDRGHLLPSADRDDTPQENRATFLLSNISPQYPTLNRGTWRLLEEQVRRWAVAYDSLYIITGPVLKAGLARIPSAGKPGIPQQYFKAVMTWHEGACHAIGFLVPNTPRNPGDFTQYALCIDDLEAALGYDFFWQLPDSIESRVESNLDSHFWH